MIAMQLNELARNGSQSNLDMLDIISAIRSNVRSV